MVGSEGRRSRLAFEMKVTEQLEEVLKHLRNGRAVTVVWMGALCMNLRDKNKRVREMTTMDFIYQNATLVSIWLGCHEDDSSLIPAFIQRVHTVESFEEVVVDVDIVKIWGALTSLPDAQVLVYSMRVFTREYFCHKGNTPGPIEGDNVAGFQGHCFTIGIAE